MATLNYEEIEEEKIQQRVEQFRQLGEPTNDLNRLLYVGQIYKDHGLTPMYMLDDANGGFHIAIKETQDRSKLH